MSEWLLGYIVTGEEKIPVPKGVDADEIITKWMWTNSEIGQGVSHTFNFTSVDGEVLFTIYAHFEERLVVTTSWEEEDD